MFIIGLCHCVCLRTTVFRCLCVRYVFFFKQKTAYEMRISDWSSDVCSSDLDAGGRAAADHADHPGPVHAVPDRPSRVADMDGGRGAEIGRASCRERV